jgi:DNA (cytosine-5)-methyltransferase 1
MFGMFKFIDLFSGIGGFRLGLESIEGVCIASSEIEKNAIEVYKNNWSTDSENHNLGDISKITELPEHDLLVGGVPCQSWSIAGKNKGIEDQRGKLWNDVIRLLTTERPKVFLFENVKGLSEPRHKDALEYLLNSFKNLDYQVFHKVLNSYDYGVSQNRERIYIVGIKKNYLKNQFNWPKPLQEHKTLYEIFDNLEKPKEEKIKYQTNLFGERINVGFNKLTPIGEKNNFFVLADIRNGPTTIHSWEIQETSDREKNICITILKNRRKSLYGSLDGNSMSFFDLKNLIPDLKEDELKNLIEKKILKIYDENKYDFFNRRLSSGINGVNRIYLPNSTFFPTITATGSKDFISTINIYGKTDSEYKHNFIEKILKRGNYRGLTTQELLRLQGYPNNFKIHKKDSINIKLFGNSVSVPVIREIGKSIIKSIS